MTDELCPNCVTPWKCNGPHLTDELPSLPLPAYEAYYYSAVQMRAYATAAVAREREKWIGGIKVSFPTDAMEQEIASHVRRAVGREQETSHE